MPRRLFACARSTPTFSAHTVANPNDTLDITLIVFFMFFGSVLCVAVFVYRTGNLRVLIALIEDFMVRPKLRTDPSPTIGFQSDLFHLHCAVKARANPKLNRNLRGLEFQVIISRPD